MRFNQVKNIKDLQYYLENSKTSLTVKKVTPIDYYGVRVYINVIYSYSTPIAYIITNPLGRKEKNTYYPTKILYVLEKGENFSVTTAKYLYTLRKICDVLISREMLKTILSNAGFTTGKL